MAAPAMNRRAYGIPFPRFSCVSSQTSKAGGGLDTGDFNFLLTNGAGKAFRFFCRLVFYLLDADFRFKAVFTTIST